MKPSTASTHLAGRSWDLLAFGDPCADVTLAVDQWPVPGGKVLGRPLGVWPGGTTANVACAAARLGLRVAAHGRVGGDAHGALLRESFEAFGVGTLSLQTEAGSPSASALAMVSPSGEKSIVYMPMPPAPMRYDALDAALRQSRAVYAMPYDLAEFHPLCELARAHRTQVAIDIEPAVAPDGPAMLARVSRCDIAFFNEAGFHAGTGEPASHVAMRRLLDAGPRVVVVSLGERGALAVDRGGEAAHAAFPARVVDTTGAGDSFNAAFLTALLEGQLLAQSLRFACAAASHTVAAMGARAGLPGRAAVDALVGQRLGDAAFPSQGGVASTHPNPLPRIRGRGLG
jgi:sugar/nucleoside kinase (ribokinase family)